MPSHSALSPCSRYVSLCVSVCVSVFSVSLCLSVSVSVFLTDYFRANDLLSVDYRLTVNFLLSDY
jgi:hypothetical protein